MRQRRIKIQSWPPISMKSFPGSQLVKFLKRKTNGLNFSSSWWWWWDKLEKNEKNFVVSMALMEEKNFKVEHVSSSENGLNWLSLREMRI